MKLEKLSLGDIVSNNFRTARVFEKYGLDYCCNGNKSLEYACNEKSVDISKVIQSLGEETTKKNEFPDFKNLSLDKLIDYILKIHHNYLYDNAFPSIVPKLKKLVKVHGKNHPELEEIAFCFESMVTELEQHMQKEEMILFPYIKALSETNEYSESHFGTVNNPIRVMESEHERVGKELTRLRDLTNNYTPPEDACNTYRTAYKELEYFEEDIHKHIHLENNILHPGAIELENKLFSENEVKI